MKNPGVLGTLSPEEFLASYWQKLPLLIRNSLPNYIPPLSPDELAGLACSDDVESRIVLEKAGKSPWELQHGPFDETAFAQLPESHWTLLIQECNKHVPEFALLLEQFNFIPNWRVDDVMVSFAVTHGSVGPHVDQYDVFLLQGAGQRRWQISAAKPEHMEFIPETELRILEHFNSEQEWVLNPGDMLYLPPGIAHFGVALEECMTISIGFRAPSHYELLTHFAEQQFQNISDPFRIPRYQDPGLTLADNCGEITDEALQEIITTIHSYSRDPLKIKRWFGSFITEPKHEADFPNPDINIQPEQLHDVLASQNFICRSEYARFSFINNSDGTCFLYINGQEYVLDDQTRGLAPAVCNQRRIDTQNLLQLNNNLKTSKLLCDFFNNGYLYIEDQ